MRGKTQWAIWREWSLCRCTGSFGAKGVEKIVEGKLDATERKQFNKSVDAVRGLVEVVKKLERVKH